MRFVTQRAGCADGALPGEDTLVDIDDVGEDAYGELVVLGFNGIRPQHWLIHPASTAKRDLCTKYRLRRRKDPNGVVPSNVIYGLSEAGNSNPAADRIRHAKTHSISYKKSKTEVFVEEYLTDLHTDMFQVGRSTDKPIDFTVRDYWPQKNNPPSASIAKEGSYDFSELNPTCDIGNSADFAKDKRENFTESTISRFACRIIANRTRPFQPKIFAAGFDK